MTNRIKQLCSAGYVPGITLSALHILIHLVVLSSHLGDKAVEAQRG